ncbi:penicillin-binding protein 2 [Permianibacter sp. IMCC34836]|uniref:penicillin-binding protein 2 n=1 Tax=Permianibacter fluminis TaxID=2738515 RepID=UPI0015581B0B|nr:penicillin-binding protein 2 [Permianibacter fluminis]NQD36632.1 penicillin-binding protein 2 [Permianibacter fluminis]
MNRRMRMKDPVAETSLFFVRATIAAGVVGLLTLVLATRLFYLQIVEHHQYRTLADRNRISVQPIAPTRGLIYDRNGVLLAENRSSFALEMIPAKVTDIAATLDQLASIVTITDDDRERFAAERKQHRRDQPVPIRSRLSDREVAVFASNQHRFPGVTLTGRLIRYYPFGPQLVHALGYVGRINDKEWEKLDQNNYAATQHIGKLGLEKHYEDVLHGAAGFQEVETDVHDRVVRVLNRVPPIPGRDLHLHLDSGLQMAALSALGDQRGVVIAVDPNTGGVLALVSAPGYDPNPFVTGIDRLSYQGLLESPDVPLYNRALLGVYPPGSTVKPVLALAGLNTGATTIERKIFDPGWFKLPGDDRRYRDWVLNKGLPAHGWLDVRFAISQSCDTYFYDLANRMGIDKLSEQMQRFGFGQLTGIDVDEEVRGLLPTREWKRRARKDAWYPGETISVGIGQGYWSATSLQLVNAAATLANGGVRRELRMVDSIGSLDNAQKVSAPLAAVQPEVASPAYLEVVRGGMRDVVMASNGTARKAFVGVNYDAAGKTGTAQVTSYGQNEKYDATKIDERFRDNALFIGFAPFDKPQIAVAVLVENVIGGGASNAAPIARRVMDHYLAQSREPNAKRDQEPAHD